MLRSRGVKTVIPEPSDQVRNRRRRGTRGGRPPKFDADTYRCRNVVERSFNTVKQWRGLATRYDKFAIVYRGAAVLRANTTWLKHFLETHPRRAREGDGSGAYTPTTPPHEQLLLDYQRASSALQWRDSGRRR